MPEITEKLIKTLRNWPMTKIDLLYDERGWGEPGNRPGTATAQPAFLLRSWHMGLGGDGVAKTREIKFTPTEFIELLKAGLDYYEVNGEAIKKLGLELVKK